MSQTNHHQCSLKYHRYAAEDIAALIAGRKIYIYGGGKAGSSFELALKRHGFEIEAFLDRAHFLIGMERHGKPVLDPNVFLSNNNARLTSFVFVAAITDKANKEMVLMLRNSGFEPDKDFISFRKVSPVFPVIDISGLCNLRCISCSRNDPNRVREHRKAGFMSAGNYEKVINKLVEEIPFLHNVDLYSTGEPLLNPDLPAIIKINNRLGIGSHISTNLNYGKHLEETVKAGPTNIRATSFKSITRERRDTMENLGEGTHGDHEGRSGPAEGESGGNN
ncbi:MAG: hypothetical protein LBL56_03605 [Treponema sp.]|jgi:uncharacterized radical SAM superfamily Fe-S cluster-containing enzyme|nr:hypothetical protein [Treponema sp.]